MPTDEERRKIAARLRTLKREDTKLVYIEEILSAFIGGFTVTNENEVDELLVLDRIADLIEPEERTCRRVTHGLDRDRFVSTVSYTCSECDAHIGRADRHCHSCGAKVVEDV